VSRQYSRELCACASTEAIDASEQDCLSVEATLSDDGGSMAEAVRPRDSCGEPDMQLPLGTAAPFGDVFTAATAVAVAVAVALAGVAAAAPGVASSGGRGLAVTDGTGSKGLLSSSSDDDSTIAASADTGISSCCCLRCCSRAACNEGMSK
jgi:hypothetical protein